MINIFLNKASKTEIMEYLKSCDTDFLLALTNKVELKEYSKKIFDNAIRFEAWDGDSLVGLVAAYFNDQVDCKAYITSVSVLPEWQGKKIATRLIEQCIEYAKKNGMASIGLEVENANNVAIELYKKFGFLVTKKGSSNINMNLFLDRR